MSQPKFDVEQVLSAPAFRTARDCIHATDNVTVAHMREATAIAAPTGSETARGRWIAEQFRGLGLNPVIDEVGNISAVTPCAEPDAPEIAVVAHLDTVFAHDTDLTLRTDGDRISAPGISDNGRGLAGILALARSLHQARWPTRAPVSFVATVGEEGIGDLLGAKHYVAARADRIGVFIALDGAGASRIIHAGVGSRRMRATFRGPGGHSWADFGAPNAIHAVGRAITALMAIELPQAPRTTLTVARTGGGTSINAIPSEAWLEMDLRSEQSEALQALEAAALEALQRSAALESDSGAAVTCDITLFGDRPAGETAASHPLVKAAEAATRAVGLEPELTSSSTDANVAMAAGLPAVAIGAGGTAGGMHTTGEWYENENGARGMERALLLVMAAAGVR
jgi:tripeptide aminopeptidase